MPTVGDISKITLLSGNTYALKDETARESIADLSGGKTRILINAVTVNDQAMYTLTDSNGTQLTYQQIYDAYYSSKGAVFVFGSSVYTVADIYEGSVRLFMYYDADLYEFLFYASSDNYYYSNNYSAGRVIFRNDQRVCLLIVQIDGTYYITSFDNPTTPLAASEVLEAYMSVYNVFFALPVDSSGEKFSVLQAVASDISRGKIIFEGIVYDEGLVWPVNRMLLWFYTDPNTGILQSSAVHSKIYPLSSKPAVPGGTDLSFVTTGEKYATIMLNGFGVFGAPALTKRVSGGTKILNPLCIKRGAVQVGYAIDSVEQKLKFYCVFSCQQSGGVIFERWMLYKQNPTGDPYEFTFENAPSKLQASTVTTYDQYKYSSAFSLNRDPKIIDVRLCVIIKDANGLEIDRIYSAQYRYTASLSNGTVTREKVQTVNTSGKDVVDIGLVAANSIEETYNYSETADVTLLPLASSLLESGYEFFVPDEFFQDAPIGLQIVAVTGDGTYYTGPTFQMAEEDSSVRYDISQSLTSTQQETARTNIGAGSYSKPVGGIPDSDISSAATWNAKSDFSGAYADLTGKPDAVTYTQNSNVSVAGATKTTYTYGQTAIYAPNGLIMGGTAAAAGLVTRGVCGVNTPTTGGACTKDNLFINYDGDNTYRSDRQMVLQAGATGTHYGSNLYQYCAARGDAVKGYVDNKVTNFGMLPAPTASDNGKVLGVSNGAWAAETAAGMAEGIPYGEVDSTSTSTVFTATVPGITELKDGTVVLLKNGVVTSAANFTININSLGAKPAYSNMATGNDTTPTAPTRETTIFNINYTMMFIYSTTLVNGGAWICYRGYDANTNTIGYQLRTNSQNLAMSGALYRYRLLFQSLNGRNWIPANTTNSTDANAQKTTNTAVIDPFGEIMYYSGTAAVSSGSRPSASALWQQYALNIGYSFNTTGAAPTLTSWRPVYLRATPQATGGCKISSTPYTQTLPTADDTHIYILLGIAYNATNIELLATHPVYCFMNGRLQMWTGNNNAPVLPTVAAADNGKVLTVSSGAWTAATPQAELPTVTSTDNGKVLRVVDGAWAAASLPTANGVSF